MESYHVSIDQFDGPLDLLLHLIRQSEIDIRDIFVSEITAKYLAYMEELDSVDMDKVSEFLTMAATLLEIKSRQLLPRPPKEEETPEEESPEEQLIRQLLDYEAFKEAGQSLERRFLETRDSFSRLPEDVVLPPQRIDFKDSDLETLYAAFRDVLDRVERSENAHRLHHVRRDRFTVRSQLKRIRDRIRKSGEPILFQTLFSEEPDKLEVIVTFMALLEMINHGEIHLQQSAPFESILIFEKNLMNDDSGMQYMDEENTDGNEN